MTSVRLDEIDERLLDLICETYNMNRSEAIRSAIRGLVPSLVVALGLRDAAASLARELYLP
jgi:hypothetical protein